MTLAFAFTGTVLKWDQEAWEALQHNVEAARLLGGLGVWFSPQFAASVPLLARLYAAHVTLLPLLATLVFIVHFFLPAGPPRRDRGGHRADRRVARRQEVGPNVTPGRAGLLCPRAWGDR